LLSRARASEEGEAFETAVLVPGLRIGAGARSSGDFFVEVLVDPFPGGRVDLDRMEGALAYLRLLSARGYRLGCRDDHVVCGELVLPGHRVEGEMAAVRQAAGR